MLFFIVIWLLLFGFALLFYVAFFAIFLYLARAIGTGSGQKTPPDLSVAELRLKDSFNVYESQTRVAEVRQLVNNASSTSSIKQNIEAIWEVKDAVYESDIVGR